jgi:uncharacterized LabA/DUF88 family protein
LAGNNQGDEQRLALFIDFENIAIGVRDAHYPKFDINLVLERLLDKGKLLVKRAYADWSRYSDYKRSFHEAAIELIEVPQKSIGGKNSADIRLVVDAMDMSFQKEHVNSFVIASGDSDFSPLVSKLKENNKYVIGLGVKNSTSDLLIENCDEFIFYEDLVRGQQQPLPVIANAPGKLQECFGLLVDSVLALQRENKEILWGSMVKETMKRKKPSFNETYYGFRTFSHLLEDAQRRGIVILRRDQRSGSYIIEDLGSAGVHAGATGGTVSGSSSSGSGGRVEAPAPAPAPRPVEAPALAAAPAGSAAVAAAPAAEAGDAANGRAPRRRRGRGRRSRGASVLAAGAYLDQTPPSGAIEDLDDQDEPEEELSGEGHDEGEQESEASSPPAEQSPDAKSQRPRSEEGAPAAPSGEAQPDSERSPFSFFSWIRRDPPPRKED